MIGRAKLLEPDRAYLAAEGPGHMVCGSPGAELGGRNVVSALYGILGCFALPSTGMCDEDLRCQKCLFRALSILRA